VPLQDTPQDPGAAPSPPPADSGPQQLPALARRARPAALDAGSRGGEGPDGDGPSRTAASGEPAPDTRPLPRRVRQANLAPQLKQAPKRRTGHRADPAERDAEQVRSRMSSLQRGWQRGREENAADDDARDSAPGTTKGDGR
jgi:hypothetical protein